MSNLTSHPRLFAGPDDLATTDARFEHSGPVAARARELYRRDLAEASARVVVPTAETGHNWHLRRMRDLQKRVVTLLVEYLRTRDVCYRRLIFDYLRLADSWEYWSWIDWRGSADTPQDPYDLSFGEMGMTLAVVYDWLYDELDEDERELLLQMARRQTDAFLRGVAEGAWWTEREYSNWTAATNGGAGMLALAAWEELDRAEEILQHVERSIGIFFGSIREDGGWPEGVGYWNYGMRYGFLYLLSHEAATGTEHPLLAREAVRNTAIFPLLFSPHGQAAGFGDSNHFSALAFHYRVLKRLDLAGYTPMLDDIASREDGFGNTTWPTAALYGLLGPTSGDGSEAPADIPANRLLDGIDWGYLSDGLPGPKTFISVRGGSADVPHGHADLMAFWFQVQAEQFLINADDGGYLDTTFSRLRNELYGCGPLSKNTILLNGVGVRPDSTSRTRSFEHDGHFIIQVDTSDCFGGFGGTKAYGDRWLHYCCRTFINLGAGRYLIIDRARFSNEGQFEARFHTFLPMEISPQRQVVRICGQQETVRLRFGCSQPIVLREAISTPIMPQQPADTILQVQSEALVENITLVTLIDLAESDEALGVEQTETSLFLKLGSEALWTLPLDANGDPFAEP